FSPDSRTVAVVARRRIALWETASGKALPSPGFGADDWFQAAVFAADSSLLAIGSRPHVHIWDVAAGKWLHHLKGYWPEGYYLERSVAEESQRGIGYAGRQVDTRSIAFSRDGKLLAAASEGGKVRLWSLPDGKEMQPVVSGHEGPVWALAVSSDGRT